MGFASGLFVLLPFRATSPLSHLIFELCLRAAHHPSHIEKLCTTPRALRQRFSSQALSSLATLSSPKTTAQYLAQHLPKTTQPETDAKAKTTPGRPNPSNHKKNLASSSKAQGPSKPFSGSPDNRKHSTINISNQNLPYLNFCTPTNHTSLNPTHRALPARQHAS